MDAREIKARLDAVDAELTTKLRELGFTEDEIKRQLDTSIPQETRKAEAEQIMARKFVADLNDPSSGLMDQVVERVIEQAEAEFPGIKAEMEADKKRRRRNQLVMAGVAVAAIGAGVWYFAIRDARSQCEKIVGSLADLGAQTNKTLKKGLDFKSDRGCELMVDDDPFHGTVIHIEVRNNHYYDQQRRDLDRGGYARSEKLDAGNGWLFVAEKQRERSAEELMADAQSRVGRSRDPIGDALSAGGPSQHIALFEFGARMAIVKLSNRTFTPELARSVALDMAKRAKGL